MSIQKRRNSLLKSSISIDSIRKSVVKFREGLVKSNSTASDIVKTTNRNNIFSIAIKVYRYSNSVFFLSLTAKKRFNIEMLVSRLTRAPKLFVMAVKKNLMLSSGAVFFYCHKDSVMLQSGSASFKSGLKKFIKTSLWCFFLNGLRKYSFCPQKIFLTV